MWRALVLVAVAVSGLFHPKPEPGDVVGTARWLVHEASWGVVAAVSDRLGGAPFGGVQSFSDGATPSNGTGVPYFYMTRLDASAHDLMKRPQGSFTVSEASLLEPHSACFSRDPEDPTCVRVTLSGTFAVVTDRDELQFAEESLFWRHPAMRDWPKDHSFQVWVLHIEDIYLLDNYGGPPKISVSDYLQYRRPGPIA